MVAPSANDIRTWSKLNFSELGYPSDSPDPLDLWITRAVAYVEDVTGRLLTGMPANFETIAQEAVQKRVEQEVFQNSGIYVQSASQDLATSLGVSGYSEGRRQFGEYRSLVNSWPALHDLLWRLMTDEKRSEWLYWTQNEDTPAIAIAEIYFGPDAYTNEY